MLNVLDVTKSYFNIFTDLITVFVSKETLKINRAFADEPSLADAEQEVETVRDETSTEMAAVQPETQAEQVTMATAAEPTHTVSVPLPPVEDAKNKKGDKYCPLPPLPFAYLIVLVFVILLFSLLLLSLSPGQDDILVTKRCALKAGV